MQWKAARTSMHGTQSVITEVSDIKQIVSSLLSASSQVLSDVLLLLTTLSIHLLSHLLSFSLIFFFYTFSLHTGNVEKDNRHHRVSRAKTPQSLSHPTHTHHPTQSVIAARNNAAVSASAFKVDQKVLVCTEQNVLWDARVVELRAGMSHY